MFISGPRASSLGSEQGTTLNSLMKGQGGDHITSSVVFDVSGSVGIGSSSPTARLDVAGEARITGSVIGNQTSVAPIIGGGFGTTALSNTQNTTAGAVIGTYNSAFAFIDLATRAAAGSWIDFSSGSGDDYQGRIRYSNSDQQFNIYTSGSSTPLLNIGIANVGIGTTTPAAKLDIRGGSDGDAMISIGSNSISGILNSQANIYINADSDNDSSSGVIGFGFNRTGYTGGTEAMRILENGSVGISTTSPSSRLEIIDNAPSESEKVLSIKGTGTLGVSIHISGSTNYRMISTGPSSTPGGGNFGIYSDSGSAYAFIIRGSKLFNFNSTTFQSWGTNATAIQLSGSGVIYNDGFQNFLFANNSYYNGSNNIYIKNGFATRYYQELSAGSHYFQVASSGTAGGTVSYNTALYIDSSKAVGVNTTTTSWASGGTTYAPLFNVDGGSANTAYFNNTSAASANVTIAGLNYFLSLDSGSVRVADFRVNGNSLNITAANHILFNPSGNVGIGTTNATQKLHVFGNSGNPAIQVQDASSTFALMGILGAQAGDVNWLLMSGYPNAGDFTIRQSDVVNAITIKKTSGNVGIGTTSPTVRLHVSGTTGGIFEVDGASAVTALYVSASGFVGIGSATPGYRLDINGGATDTTLAVQTTGQNAVRLRLTNEERSFILTNNPADDLLSFNYDGNNRFQFDTTNQWFNSGNVGIGTTSPSSTFHVRGLFGAPSGSGSSQNGIARFGQTSGNGILDIGFGDPYSWLQSRSATDYSTNYNLSLQPNGGNVGIGTTSPAYKLDVDGTTRTTGNTILASGGAYVSIGGAPFYAGTSVGSLSIKGDLYPGIAFYTGSEGLDQVGQIFSYAGTGNMILAADPRGVMSSTTMQFEIDGGTKMLINSSGNVGIGTTNPSSKLHISSGRINITAASSGQYDLIRLENNSSSANGAIGVNSSGFMYLSNTTGGTQHFVLDGNGNIGIGVTTPKAKLQVRGAVSSEKKYDGREDGLVLYYPFSENTGTTTVDRSQTGMIGTLTNGPSWSDGIFGYSLALDGSNDYVSVAAPDSSVSFGTAMTYAMWIYPTSTVAQRYYLIDPRGDGNDSGMTSYFLFDRESSTSVTFTTGNSGFEVISGNVTMGTNQWYHVAATRSGNTWKIYLNGVQIHSGTTNTTTLTLSNSFRIGTYSAAGTGPQYYFKGNIDEARIYNRTLSANELMTLYLEGVGTTAPYTNASGYVGIGTTSPASNLHIYNAGQPPVNDGLYANVILDTDSTSNYQRIRYDVGATPYWGLGREGSTNDFILSGRIGSSWSDGVFKIQQSSGNVGINTTSPSSLLHVQGTARITGQFVQGSGGTRSTNGTTIALTDNTTFSANSDIGDGSRFLSIVNESTSVSAFSNICFRINPASGGSSGNVMLDMKFVNNGSVTSTLYWTFLHSSGWGDKLSLTSAGTLTAAGDVVAYSDARLKENVITIDNAVEKVTSMRGVFFNKKDDETKSRKVGVIAQEIQEILPEVVTASADGTLGVAYGNMVGILIEAIKEQQQQIDELKYLLQTINK
jgi:hypothetical protein